MRKMKYMEEGKQILALVGGKENVRSLVHCATRLRFELKDESKADDAKLEALPYVLKVIRGGGQVQVVIGAAVHDYWLAIQELGGFGGEGASAGSADSGAAKQKPLDVVLKVISGAFSPIIPLMAGSGMIKALLTLLTTLGLLSDASSTYLVLSAAGNACFYFLPVFLGFTISKQLGANPYVGAAIGAALLEPNFTGLVGVEGTDFLGLGLQAVSYGSTIFPIFIAATIYSFLDKGIRKFINQDLQLFLAPMIDLLIMVPFTALVFGPFGNNVGDAIAAGVQWLFNLNGFLAGLILGAVYPYLTMLGLHWGFTPITLQNLEMYGGDFIEGVCVCAVWAQMGIALGCAIRAKKGSKVRDIAQPTFVTGFLAGVTEPILYGLVMNYRRLMVIVAIAGAAGGALAGGMGATMNAYIFHNVISVATLCYSPMPLFLVAIATSLAVGCVLTVLWGVDPEDKADFEAPVTEAELEGASAPAAATESAEGLEVEVVSPAAGEVKPLSEATDVAFSSGAMGQGVVLLPSEGKLVSPVSGTVSMLFPTGHAVGITTDEGVELLMHIGIDTVTLNGQGFVAHVKQGDKVKAGQPLMDVDLDFVKSKGLSTETPIIVTNPDATQSISCAKTGTARAGDKLMVVTL